MSRSQKWKQEEIDLLQEFWYKLTRLELVALVQEYQREHNLFVRSYKGINCKIQELGFDSMLQEDRFNRNQLAKILGVNISRVYYWGAKGLPYARGKSTSCSTTIERAEFIKWAETESNLHLLRGLSREAILSVTGNAELANRVAKLRPYFCGVVNITTGKSYDSVVAAATDTYTDPTNLHHALKHGRKCCGFEWAYMEAT